MSIWYAIWDALPFEMLHWDFMKNALLALLLVLTMLTPTLCTSLRKPLAVRSISRMFSSSMPPTILAKVTRRSPLI